MSQTDNQLSSAGNIYLNSHESDLTEVSNVFLFPSLKKK